MQYFTADNLAPTRPDSFGHGRSDWLRRLRMLSWVALMLLPTVLSGIYLGFIASDRYVAEARFVIRSASQTANQIGGVGALLQMIGLARTADDAYVVRDYLTSRDALDELGRKLDLKAMFNRPGADFLTRYPSLLFDSSSEDFFRYYQHAVTIYVNTTSNITVMEVNAFRPDDAAQIARTLLDMGEALVNHVNERSLADAVHVAEGEVTRAEARRLAAQQTLTTFRTRELILDPTATSISLIELIGKLSASLAVARAEIAETEASARSSPQLQPLRLRAEALQAQIALQRANISGGDEQLARKIGEYEKLKLEEQFAIRALDQSTTGLRGARAEARRQQLFLERVVEPRAPDKSMRPQRLSLFLTIFGFNAMGFGILWLAGAGLREHAAGGH